MGINYKQTFNLSKDFEENLSIIGAALPAIIQTELTVLKERTNRGLDKDNSTFVPYSKSYQKFRAKKGYQVSPPNLRRTGQMMTSIISNVKEIKKHNLFVKYFPQHSQTELDLTLKNVISLA
jgi:hypothetical protein